jgi:hypothetical protein
MRQSGWLPLLLGLGLGLAGGLFYSWIVNPVEYVETAPGSLREDFKADYLALIAAAYASHGDLVRARARLALFEELNPAGELAALAQRRQASGHPLSEAEALAELAAALQGAPTPGPTEVLSASATPAPPSPTPTPTRTRAPSATPGAPFRLAERERVCDPLLAEPLIQVQVSDAAGGPVSGAEVLVIWDEGQDRFFTGLKPELGLGYADFSMAQGVTYSLQLSATGEPITGLATFECSEEEGESYLGSWLLQFEQPGP